MPEIIDFRIDDLPDAQAFSERSAEIEQQVGQTVDRSRGLIAAVGWDAVRDTAFRKLTESLGAEDREAWFVWLAKAWTLSSKLRAAGKETLGDETAEKVIPLKSHPLAHTVHPVVTLVCGPLTIPLTFDLELKGAIDLADLVVRGGRLVAVQGARLTPSAALSYREVPLGKKAGKPIEVKRFDLPGGGLKLVDEPQESVAAE
jgi:hypothetical protein